MTPGPTEMSGRSPWSVRLKLSLRAQLTIAATTVAALVLTVGGTLTLIMLQQTLLRELDESARSHGHDIAALVEADRLTNPLPSSGAAIAQVVDAQGRVLASTPGGDRLVPILSRDDLAVVRAGEAIDMPGTRIGQPEPFRAIGIETGPPDGPQTVLVAVSLAEQRRTANLLRLAIVGAGVVVAAAVGLLSWFVTGRTLRPVEQLRSGAAEITGTGEQRLLPVPVARDELHRLATTLNDMLKRLEAASARQRAFVADAAHELRSPIAALRTELEVGLAHPDAVDPYETAREALAEVERMERLVEDLLILARLDEPRRRTSTDVDLRDVTRDVVDQLRDPRVPIRVDATESAWVFGDPHALGRLVRNLVDNAVRHAVTGVDVDVRSLGILTELRVSNDGPPVPLADRERIFERFTRLDDARGRDAGGTGLGLAIVREIAQAHGGHVTVGDAFPGARFTVRLPVRHSGTRLS
ncbi:sensor histidine kinase [Phytoactinopolyspora mesophila]|uniref:histidine kinase n=1 Tax=Phytoactinopolyspora mesophila TaxID=2650750 RepID=A0A7K3LZU3_9ACTN|nr:ATP-binding protein [Phytoactinopolyspora mesophila]NDL56317.1 HAMP domain-containing protein [Phytoactinopolyspora mesophila]